MKVLHFIIIYIILVSLLLMACNRKEYLLYTFKIKKKDSRIIQSDSFFEISKDSILYFPPSFPEMYLSKGKLIKLNKNQLLFISEFNIDSIDMIVNSEFCNYVGSVIKFNNYYKGFSNFWDEFNDVNCKNDKGNKFYVIINKTLKHEINDGDSLIIPEKIKEIQISFETCRSVKNPILKTVTFNNTNYQNNTFNIETYFSNYQLNAVKRIDTLTLLPLNRIKVGNKYYHLNYFNRNNISLHDSYGYQ